MEGLFTLQEASDIDHRLILENSLKESELIDSAAKGALEIARKYIENKRVLFLVGKGNNGSDALHMALLSLPLAASVMVYPIFENGNQENMGRREAVAPYLVDGFRECDVVVDGVFGFSFHGSLSPSLEFLFSSLDHSSSFKIALDVPSAFAYSADLTVTFMCGKTELYYPENRKKCGRIEVFNPGFPSRQFPLSEVKLLSSEDYSPLPISFFDYKNTRGHLLVAGGSQRYMGAPILSSLSAFHSGVGLVSLYSEEIVLDKVLSSHPSIMGVRKENLSSLRVGGVLMGPGWGEGKREVIDLYLSSSLPMVLDADAIKLVKKEDRFGFRAVLTPHMGEYRRLLSNLGLEEDDFLTTLKKVAKTLECVIVVKSSVIWITDGDETFVWDGSNPALGVAGSGDVLSGIIGAFLAHGEKPLSAAMNGVILHQTSGRKAAEALGYFTSEDLIEEVGRNR